MPGILTLFSEIEKAAERIAPYAIQTPILSSVEINKQFSAEIFFKCENLQKSGAFKFRGACNAIFSLQESEAAHGVATHSSGNHGAALALAGSLRNIPVHVVMPENAPQIKIDNVTKYGAHITFCKPTLHSRETTLEQVIHQTGATVIHPYNDYRVIFGQGTAARELLLEQKNLDAIITPVGGGGLISGTCIAVKNINPDIQVIGAEPKGADDAFRSLAKGEIIPQTNPNTMADGLLSSLGDKTFSIMKQYVSQIITVSEEHIIQAMRGVYGSLNMLIEPSSAVALAAVLEQPEFFRRKKIGIILSGGNIRPEDYPST